MVAPLEIPELVRQRAISNGVAGRRWLEDLPDVVSTLTARWGLVLGAAMRGGTSGFVTAATDASGRACVLKVTMPLHASEADDFRRSVLVHQLAGGRGCAELFEHDESTSAMLLERLGRNLDELGLRLPELMVAITTTLQSFWRPVAEDIRLPTGPDKATWLAGFITSTWDELGHPCERRVVDRALDYCAERTAAFDPSRAVLVHGDAHGWNTVDAGAGTFKFVDPEGLCSEREHDLSVAMREYNQPLLAGDTRRRVVARSELLASLCDVDADAVWQWGFVERVATGLANLRDLPGDESLAFLEVARRCL